MISRAGQVDPYGSLLRPPYIRGFPTTATMASIAEVSKGDNKSFGMLKG